MDTNKIKNLLNEVKNGTKSEKDVTDEIMKDYGIAIADEQAKTIKIQTELDNANTKIKTYETEITTLKESSKENDGYKEKFDALEKKIKAQEIEDQKRKEDELLTNNIISTFGDKKFTSDYVKNGLIADIKEEFSKPENRGKGINDIFENLTKDKEGIFAEPEQPKIKGAVPGEKTEPTAPAEITKDEFNKMGYKKRVELKQNQPELYQSLVEK